MFWRGGSGTILRSRPTFRLSRSRATDFSRVRPKAALRMDGGPEVKAAVSRLRHIDLCKTAWTLAETTGPVWDHLHGFFLRFTSRRNAFQPAASSCALLTVVALRSAGNRPAKK